MIKEIFQRILSSIMLIIISFFFIIKGNLYFSIFLILTMFLSLYEWHKMKLNNKYYFIGIIFIIYSFFCANLIRNHFDNGLFNFLLIVFICIGADTGGYLFGNIFKGPKLTKISPNKTYSGSLGAFFLSTLFSYFFIIYLSKNYEINIIYSLSLFIKILVLSFISQIGDIIISYFKRRAKIKDTGNLIPGHGGILDRIDGLIFVCSFFYITSLLII